MGGIMDQNGRIGLKALLRVTGLAFAALQVQACGNTPDAANVSAAQAPAATLTAAGVLKTLTDHGVKVVNVREVTESSDDNHLLGRPGQYTSKLFFYDSRHPKQSGNDTEGESTIEVFTTPEDAQRRRDYIDTVTKGMPFALQYQLLYGRALVRLDKILTPSEVAEYKAALRGVE